MSTQKETPEGDPKATEGKILGRPYEQCDLSGRSCATPDKVRHWIADSLMAAGGDDPASLRQHGLPTDVHDSIVRGVLLIGSGALTAASAGTFLHLAAGDHGLHAGIALFACGVGALQATIDHAVQYRGTQHEKAIAFLSLTGLKLPEKTRSRTRTLVNWCRALQGVSLGALTAASLTLTAMLPATDGYRHQEFLANNRERAIAAEQRGDARIAQKKHDVDAAEAQVARLQKIANPPRRGARSDRRAPHRQSPEATRKLDTDLAAAKATRDRAKDELARLQADRNAAINRDIQTSPGFVPESKGLAAQLKASEALIESDPLLLLPIALLAILSTLLELGPLWASRTQLPSACSIRNALKHFTTVTKLGEDAVRELGIVTSSLRNDPGVRLTAAANDNADTTSNGAIMKRGRGRPRKNGVDHPTSEAVS